MVPYRKCDFEIRGQPEGLIGQLEVLRGQFVGQEASWKSRQMVKRAVRGSDRPIGVSRGELEALRGPIRI